MGLISGQQEIPPTCQPEKDNNPKKKMVKGYNEQLPEEETQRLMNK